MTVFIALAAVCLLTLGLLALLFDATRLGED